jgi:predicted nucleic acid-binding protein
MSDTEIARVIADFEELAVLITPNEHFPVVVNDPKDDKFIDCAVAGNAHILVSGDKHLLNLGLYQQIGILPPSAFINLFTNGHPPDRLLF